jgi:glycine cleavage system aminomethyltransferase T
MCNCTYSYDYFIIFFNSEHKATPRTAKNVVKLATLQRHYSCAYKALQGVRCKARYRGLTITGLFSPLLHTFLATGYLRWQYRLSVQETPVLAAGKMGLAAVLPPLEKRSSGKLTPGN